MTAGIVGAPLLLSFSAHAANTVMVNALMDNGSATSPLANGTVTPQSVNAPITVPLSVTCTVGNGAAINTALAAAQTPQQAARLFAKLISPAIGQAVANAVQQVLVQTGQNQSTVNPPTATAPIQGWQDLVAQNGLWMTLNWPSPGLATAGNLPVTILQAGQAPTVSGAFLRVSVNGTF
jgi:hypothetical protein